MQKSARLSVVMGLGMGMVVLGFTNGVRSSLERPTPDYYRARLLPRRQGAPLPRLQVRLPGDFVEGNY
jgi:hypothetical protein